MFPSEFEALTSRAVERLGLPDRSRQEKVFGVVGGVVGLQGGNHEGHQYFMYRSTCGGCCDCGDASAWSPSGFCSKHKGAAGDLCEAAVKAGELAAALPARSRVVLFLVLRVVGRHLLDRALRLGCESQTADVAHALKKACDASLVVRRYVARVFFEAVEGASPEADAEAFANEALSLAERAGAVPCYERLWRRLTNVPASHLLPEFFAAALPAERSPSAASVVFNPFRDPLETELADARAAAQEDRVLKEASCASGSAALKAGEFDDEQPWEEDDEEWKEVRLLGLRLEERPGGEARGQSSPGSGRRVSLPSLESLCSRLLLRGAFLGNVANRALTTLWLALMFDEFFKAKFAFVFAEHYASLVLEADPALERVTVQVLSTRPMLERLLRRGLLLPQLFACTRLFLRCLAHGPPPLALDLTDPRCRRRASIAAVNDLRYLLGEVDLLAERKEGARRPPSSLQ